MTTPSVRQFVEAFRRSEDERKSKRRAKYAARREHYRAIASNWRSKNVDKVRLYNQHQKNKVKVEREKYTQLVAQLAALQGAK